MATRIVIPNRDGALIACDGGVKGAGSAQRHAHIVISLRLVGIDREGGGIALDRLVEAAGAMGL